MVIHKALAQKGSGGVWKGSREAEQGESLHLKTGKPGASGPGRQTDKHYLLHAPWTERWTPLPDWPGGPLPHEPVEIKQGFEHQPCHASWTDRWTPPSSLPDNPETHHRWTALPPPLPTHHAGMCACSPSVPTARVPLGAAGDLSHKTGPAWAGDHGHCCI